MLLERGAFSAGLGGSFEADYVAFVGVEMARACGAWGDWVGVYVEAVEDAVAAASLPDDIRTCSLPLSRSLAGHRLDRRRRHRGRVRASGGPRAERPEGYP